MSALQAAPTGFPAPAGSQRAGLADRRRWRRHPGPSENRGRPRRAIRQFSGWWRFAPRWRKPHTAPTLQVEPGKVRRAARSTARCRSIATVASVRCLADESRVSFRASPCSRPADYFFCRNSDTVLSNAVTAIAANVNANNQSIARSNVRWLDCAGGRCNALPHGDLSLM